MNIDQKIQELNQRKDEIQLGGGVARIEKQHEGGSLTARERLNVLLDQDSFQETGLFARHRGTLFGMAEKEMHADGVVTGAGSVNSRLVHIACQDFTVGGGSVGEIHSAKIVQMMQSSLKTGSPFIMINDSGGARIQEGIDSLSGYGKVFYNNVMLSGVVPQISLICGPCAGGAAYSPALTDFIIQTKSARIFITGPSVIKAVTGEEVSSEDLGGPAAQMNISGVVHFIAEDDMDAIAICKRLLSFLPSNNLEDPPRKEAEETILPDKQLNEIVPVDPKQSYDVRDVIGHVVDHADFMEVQAFFASNIVIGFARLQGRSVGIVANQPCVMAGVLDINASDKAARFIRFCNAFNIPLLTFVDVPGFLPGVEQEYGGIIRHGAKMLFAYSAATVPKITVIMRKAYGGAYLAMCCKDLDADRVISWPTAEIAVMGAEGAVDVIFRNEIKKAEDPVLRRQELITEYRDTFSTPYVSASRLHVDDIIEPADTRRYLALALDILHSKREFRPQKKHGLIPL
ncbi:acyl-CoA carboxylase subunit beta [Chlorobium phaeobacteroides]|jgi:methylmalonyl-CoA carboxyltransferase large subunit|uniref:Carboxyl transferase n=1 Tax=Chlorobium phaeobacteroides (strain DSM 266 / SMG 266 / 2430) TaxID=290317 RepID=A1BGT7_CHLPD|nr:acyl-CoA carboxylase subunit beta [Chlorobium phaeobacteroides]ABL65614.1 carboxyl transferase [Chlorobium phaeobacteroides DSM 266]MBV5328166.1 acyl-CoA carboxylase subunit beta [Chlorobium sp.]